MFKIIREFNAPDFTEELEKFVTEGFELCSFQVTEDSYIALLEKNVKPSSLSIKLNQTCNDLLSPNEKANISAQRIIQEEVQRYFEEGCNYGN